MYDKIAEYLKGSLLLMGNKTTAMRLAVFLIIIIICIYLFLQSQFFYVKNITVTGNENVSPQLILELSQLTTGKNIFTVNGTMAQRSVQIHPMILKAEIKRHLPDTLEINVKERKVWAVVPYENYYMLLDRNGVYMDKVNYLKNNQYPIITFEDIKTPLTLGQTINKEGIEQVVSIWDKMDEKTRNQISEFHYENSKNEIIIYTIQGTEIRFGNLDRIDEKTAFFEQIFIMEKEIQEQGREILVYVDMRFAGQPVVQTR